MTQTAPTSEHTRRPPTDTEREAMAIHAQQLRRQSLAASQWGGLPDKVRRILCAYAGLREANPGESLGSIAAREWHEFTASERFALGQATRLLSRRLSQLTGLMQRWWLVGE